MADATVEVHAVILRTGLRVHSAFRSNHDAFATKLREVLAGHLAQASMR